MNDNEKWILDSQLWHACAGGMVQMPWVNSKVFYFPQGHAEHAQSPVNFATCLRIPAQILCSVTSLKYMADPDTDEVFAKIRMIPLRLNGPDYDEEEDDALALSNSMLEIQGKPASFAKTLTQSDANNGGGFSVPRYCAETIFPRLDYSADPPVQTVLAKDVHGVIWKFRHIYRGTPRRHLLTTGWSSFVNQKRLVAGDSIVFLRTENGDLCVGIRRAKRGIGGWPEPPSGWNPPPTRNCMYGGFSVFLREEENKLIRGNINGGGISSSPERGKMKAESVIEAATLAANGQPFEVIYYPRASTPEFCVKASAVKAALRTQWCSGLRFKMAFETEDSSRISWFMGTISAVQVSDPIRWPRSPWRLLQVTWDEPDLLQNVKCVSPWLVELVSNMPTIHYAPFSSPKKKPRILQHLDLILDAQLPTPPYHGNPLTPSSGPLCCLSGGILAAGIQGARHTQYGISLPQVPFGKLRSGMFHAGIQGFDHFVPSAQLSTGLIVPGSTISEDVSCLLTIGIPSQRTMKKTDYMKECNAQTPRFLLFGKPILTEQQLSLSTNTSSNLSYEKTVNLSDFSGSAIHQNATGENSSPEGLSWFRDQQMSELNLDNGHCKVFMESEDVGRTIELTGLCSYEELYGRLANMFGIEKHELTCRVLYRDASGVVKYTGDEPFDEFMKTARRITILMDSGSDNMGKLRSTPVKSAVGRTITLS